MVILSIVHALNFRTMFHIILISFPINCSTTEIVFANKLLCQMKCDSKTQILHLICQKFWLLKYNIINVRSITKSETRRHSRFFAPLPDKQINLN